MRLGPPPSLTFSVGLHSRMSIRAYKWGAAVLACAVVLLAWRCFTLYRQMITAAFISFECETTEKIAASELDPAVLAHHLEFLNTYYNGRMPILAGSGVYRVVQRDYQHSVSNTLAAFRRVTTNDLGDDPRAWIQKYGYRSSATQPKN
jgi:hypothetical protein